MTLGRRGRPTETAKVRNGCSKTAPSDMFAVTSGRRPPKWTQIGANFAETRNTTGRSLANMLAKIGKICRPRPCVIAKMPARGIFAQVLESSSSKFGPLFGGSLADAVHPGLLSAQSGMVRICEFRQFRPNIGAASRTRLAVSIKIELDSTPVRPTSTCTLGACDAF